MWYRAGNVVRWQNTCLVSWGPGFSHKHCKTDVGVTVSLIWKNTWCQAWQVHWVWVPEPRRWKERTKSHKLPSDLHTPVITCMLAHTEINMYKKWGQQSSEGLWLQARKAGQRVASSSRSACTVWWVAGQQGLVNKTLKNKKENPNGKLSLL